MFADLDPSRSQRVVDRYDGGTGWFSATWVDASGAANLEIAGYGFAPTFGVLGPEAMEPQPFLDLLNDYASPWGMIEMPC